MNHNEEEIRSKYLQLYNEKYSELSGSDEGKKERIAQKFALKELALSFFDIDKDFEPEEKVKIWKNIYSAHVFKKTGTPLSEDSVEKIISAAQSWKSASGHVFEEFIQDVGNKVLADTSLRFFTKPEVKAMLDNNELTNEVPDVSWLKSSVKSDNFDLFVLRNQTLLGCVQVKTSIRDRVTRDREFSADAMSHYFWSIIFVLDGTQLATPKYKTMVNGNGDVFRENGWHAAYCLYVPEGTNEGRINLLDKEWNNFKTHAIKAEKDWSERRQWFKREWTA